jgi:MacB-like periplasmic core domain
MVREYFTHWRERRRRNREIGEELAFHLELCVDENLAKGMNRHEALEEARMRFGDFQEIHSVCCRLAAQTEPDNADPVLTYSPLSVSMSVWLLIGTLAPAALLWLFTPHLLRPLPYPAADHLYVTKHSMPLASDDETKFSFFAWQQRNTVFTDLAGFTPLTVELLRSAGHSNLPGLAVSPNFFRVFGVRPLLGATFSDANAPDAATPSVVLSYALWKELGGDPTMVGRNLVFDRRPVKVAAVMPAEFWFLSTEPRFWVPLDRNENWPRRLRAVGRLQAGVEPQEMVWELSEMAGREWNIHLGSWIVALPEITHRNFRAALAVILAPLAVTLALGFVQIMSLCRLVAPARLKSGVVARYYAFLLTKSALALLPAAAVWLVLTESAGLSGPRWLAAGVRPTATAFFLFVCAAMVWWSLVDQRLRCPVCFRRLRMPVSLGTLGSILFDLPATEYICTHGHGTLHVPEPQTNELETTRWRPHGDVWEELLAGAKK